MALCFVNTEDQKNFDSVVKVLGLKTATEYYIKYGKIGTVEGILKSLEDDLFFGENKPVYEKQSPYNMLFSNKENPVGEFLSLIRIENKKNTLRFLKAMSKRLGVGYNIVSLAEAQRITGRTKFHGGGFYKAGEVYFIEGEYNSDSVFHEFAHPIVKALAIENPELFNSLINIIPADFQEQVRERYEKEKTYDLESQRFKEEILVQYLEKSNREEAKNPKTIIGKILFALKQFLRKVFGRKINLKELSVDTTISEFIDMLNYGKEFQFDRDIITEDDFTYFQNLLWDTEKKIEEETLRKSQYLIDTLYKSISNQIQNIESSPEASFLEKSLLSPKSPLKVMQAQLRELASSEFQLGKTTVNVAGLTKEITDREREHNILTARLNEFIYQISQIDAITKQLKEVVDEFSTLNLDNKDILDKFMVVSSYLDNYRRFLDKALWTQESPVIYGTTTEIREELKKVSNNVNELLNKVNNIRVDLVTDLLYDHFNDKTERGSVFYEALLDKLKKSGNKYEYDRVYAEYNGLTEDELIEYVELTQKDIAGTIKKGEETEKLKKYRSYRLQGVNVTRDEFKEILVYGYGQNAGVAQWLNSMFESYNFNQDKVTGTFFSYVTNQMDKINALSNSRQVALLGQDKLFRLLKNAGYNVGTRNFAPSKLGRDLGSIHNKGNYNAKEDVWEDDLEWRFKSNFIGHDFEIAQIMKRLTNARDEYYYTLKTEDWETLLDIEEEAYWFKRDFMHDEAVPAYYDVENLLYTSYAREIQVENLRRKRTGLDFMDTAEENKFKKTIEDKVRIARKARTLLHNIYDSVNMIGNETLAMNDSEIAAARNEKFRDLVAARSLYENGVKKTGDDLAVAELLDAYQKGRLGRFTSKYLDIQFNAAYKNELERLDLLEEKGELTIPKEILLDEWFANNTQIAIDDSYFDLISDLIQRRADLLEPLKNKNNREVLEDLTEQGIDIIEAHNTIVQIIRKTRTDTNEYNGNFLSAEEQQTVRDAHQLIEDFNKKLYTRRGVTGEEFDKYQSLLDFVVDYGEYNLSEKDLNEFRRLDQAIRNGLLNYEGITDEAADEIISIDNKLKGLSNPVYTEYYKSHWQKAFDESEEFRKFFNNIKGTIITIDYADAFGEPEPADKDWENVELGYQLTQKDIEFILKGRNKERLEEILGEPDLIDFASWFINNHYEGDVFEIYDVRINGSEHLASTRGEHNKIYKSTNAWRNYIPSDSDYFLTYELLDDTGNTAGLLQDSKGRYRIPNINFQTRELKEEWKTPVINRDVIDENGVIIELANRDETQNRWLPRDYFENENGEPDLEQGSALAPLYIDETYKALSPEKLLLLDHLKNWHLDNQITVSKDFRSGLAYPKLRMEGGEDARELFLLKRSYFKRRANRFAEYWFGKKAADEAEMDFQRAERDYSEDKLIKNQDISLSRPVSGMYDLPIEEVTTDLLYSLQRYQHSLQELKVFNSMYSFASSLEYTMHKYEYPVGNAMRKANALVTEKAKKASGTRIQAINNIIQKYFEGVQHKPMYMQFIDKEQLEDSLVDKVDKHWSVQRISKVRENITRSLLHISSRQFFIFNVISSLSNFASAETQTIYKIIDSSLTGKWFNVVDFGIGHSKAVRTLSHYTWKTYSVKGKSAQLQLMDILDASPDKYMRNQSDAGGRTLVNDLGKLKIGYSVRTYTTHEVNYAAMYSFMNNKKFRFKLNNKYVTLDNAVELVNGRVQTKEGVPEEYSIRYTDEGEVIFGREIIRLMDLHKGFLAKIHGMGGERSEAEFFTRTWSGRIMSFLFRFLPPMLADRYQFRAAARMKKDGVIVGTRRRFNYMTEEFENGTFLDGLKLFIALAETGYSVLNPNQKATNFVQATHISGALQTLAAWLFGQIMFMFMYRLLGFDDRDDYFEDNQWTLEELGPVHGKGYRSAESVEYLKRVGAVPDLPFVSDSYRENWANGEWKGFFNEPNWWKGQLLRLLNRVERENATFWPFQLGPILWSTWSFQGAAFGGGFKNITDLFAWGFGTTSGKADDTYDKYGFTTNEQDKSLIGNRNLGPYIWGEPGTNKLYHLIIDRYLGFNGSMLNPYDAFLKESQYNPHMFDYPWESNIWLNSPKEAKKARKPVTLAPDVTSDTQKIVDKLRELENQ